MSLPVFLAPDVPSSGRCQLRGPEARHAVTVKRMRPGEFIELIDGHGTRATARIEDTPAKDVIDIQVVDSQVEEPASPQVVLVQAIPKAERSELAVDLATQAGVDAIIPWQADRCVANWNKKAAKASAKWQAVALSAAKQSRRSRIPEVLEYRDSAGLVETLDSSSYGSSVALVLHEEARVSIKEVPLICHGAPAERIYLIVGPEGGIGAGELERLISVGAIAVSLGPEVLRTATAGMAGLVALGMRTARW